jgi:hypothetical protein
MMKTLYQTCPTQKVFKSFPEGDHNTTVAEPGYFDAIWQFLVQDVLGGMKSDVATAVETDVKQSELWG